MEELAKKLRQNLDFKDFQKYLISKVDELNSLDGLAGMSNENAGEEAKARLLAADKVMDILRPFVDFREQRSPTPEDLERVKNKYGMV
jgi:hypothetical protein